MRSAFIKALVELAAEDSRILLLTGDLGFGVLDDFRKRFPDQYYNLGVAEQNLAGVGTGLALAGHVVFTYSIGNFPVFRCIEQIRNDVCYHNADVKIVTIGGGMAYGALGPSHFATEDLAIMRALPNMTVVAPGDPLEVEKLTPQIAAHKGPVYLRLGRAGEPVIQPPDAAIELGVPAVVRKGTGVLFLTTGGMLTVAMEAVDMLGEDGVEPQVVSVHTLAPLDSGLLLDMLAGFQLVVTCEEHSIVGGLGGLIAELLAESDLSPVFRRFGLRHEFPSGIGSQEYLRTANNIDPSRLASLVRSTL